MSQYIVDLTDSPTDWLDEKEKKENRMKLVKERIGQFK